MLDHRAHRDFAQLFAAEAEFLDQRAQGAHRQAKVADIRIRGVAPAKRDADPAENRNWTTVLHALPPGGSGAARIMYAV